MNGFSPRGFFISAAILTVFGIMSGCASMGNPSGGPRDEDPPKFLSSSPAPGATNVTPRRVQIEFNELVNVKDAFSKVVVSPTSGQMAKVSSQGRRIIVTMPDSLAPNTTYSINFGNSIEDVNESNRLEDFSWSFSTGPVLDTLRIGGIVLGSRDLEPQKEVVVGIHSLMEDSVFKTKRLERVAKTDERGRFIIRGLAPGTYRIFALGDLNNDYRWDNPEEKIAFTDFTVNPTSEQTIASDTILNLKTGEVDTVVERQRTRFLPNDVLLNMHSVDYKPQYIINYSRPDSTQIKILLNAKSEVTPSLAMTEAPGYRKFVRTEHSEGNDTVTFWIEPRDLVATDSLRLALKYQDTDIKGNATFKTDTLLFITPRPKILKTKKKKKDEAADSLAVAPTPHVNLTVAPNGTLDVFSPLLLEFATPIDTLYPGKFHLEQKADTLWKEVATPLPVRVDSLSLRKFKIEWPWQYGIQYRLKIDTLAAESMYGLTPKPLEQEFKVKEENQYSHLRLLLKSLPDSVPAIVELLGTNDEPVRSCTVSNSQVIFTDVAPGTYYARLYLDANGNGRYDTGNYETQTLPEQTFYYPRKIKLKQNWEISQTWDIYELPIDQQKPEAIKKNKPASNSHGKRQKQSPSEEDEEDSDFFDPTRNPFDPNAKRPKSSNR